MGSSSLADAWLKVESAIGQRPQLTGDVFAMRAQYKAVNDEANAAQIDSHQVVIEDKTIDSNIPLRIYRPIESAKEPRCLPVGLYFHGGGFCCGDLDSEEKFCVLLSERLQCVIISVAYRLAPEHKAPAQLDDAMSAWAWAHNHATDIKGDRRKYFTIGQSAGGSLALSVVRRLAVLRREHEVKGIAAIVPFAAHPNAVPTQYATKYRSFHELENSPVNTKEAMNKFYDAIDAQADDSDVYIIHGEADFDRFPPTYLAICEMDPLRDDGLILSHALKTAGVSVKMDYYKGLPHVFWSFECPAPSGDFVGDVVSGIESFLHTAE